jgi:hypothetical protein
MIELTQQQWQDIRSGGWPPEVTAPGVNQIFVLIPKEMFERVRAVLEKEDEIADVEEMYPLVTEVLDAGMPTPGRVHEPTW